MKLMIVVIQGRDVETAIEALTARGFQVTRIDSTGGFLRERNATLLIGVQEAYASEVMRILERTCQARMRFVNPLMPLVAPVDVHVADPVEVEVGGATVFMMNVARYERIA